MTRLTLNDILALEYVGNYRDDADAFSKVDEFIRDPAVPVEDACIANDDSCWRGMGLRVKTKPSDIAWMRPLWDYSPE